MMAEMDSERGAVRRLGPAALALLASLCVHVLLLSYIPVGLITVPTGDSASAAIRVALSVEHADSAGLAAAGGEQGRLKAMPEQAEVGISRQIGTTPPRMHAEPAPAVGVENVQQRHPTPAPLADARTPEREAAASDTASGPGIRLAAPAVPASPDPAVASLRGRSMAKAVPTHRASASPTSAARHARQRSASALANAHNTRQRKSGAGQQASDIAVPQSPPGIGPAAAVATGGHGKAAGGVGHAIATVTAGGPNRPPPRYPTRARRRGLQGRVVLLVRVDAAGGVAEIRVDHSSGHRMLDRAALKTVRNWRFAAHAERRVRVPVVFRLQG